MSEKSNAYSCGLIGPSQGPTSTSNSKTTYVSSTPNWKYIFIFFLIVFVLNLMLALYVLSYLRNKINVQMKNIEDLKNKYNNQEKRDNIDSLIKQIEEIEKERNIVGQEFRIKIEEMKKENKIMNELIYKQKQSKKIEDKKPEIDNLNKILEQKSKIILEVNEKYQNNIKSEINNDFNQKIDEKLKNEFEKRNKEIYDMLRCIYQKEK